jgi:hypothetical protein
MFVLYALTDQNKQVLLVVYTWYVYCSIIEKIACLVFFPVGTEFDT